MRTFLNEASYGARWRTAESAVNKLGDLEEIGPASDTVSTAVARSGRAVARCQFTVTRRAAFRKIREHEYDGQSAEGDSSRSRREGAPTFVKMGSTDKAVITGFICRLCSKMNRFVIHIYGEEGERMKLAEKINAYLPITVIPNATSPDEVDISRPN